MKPCPDTNIDDRDRAIINGLQGGFPLTETPFAIVAEDLELHEDEVIDRIGSMLNAGARFMAAAPYQPITVINASVILQNAALVSTFFSVTIAMVGTNSAAALIVNATSKMPTTSCICQAISPAAAPTIAARLILIRNSWRGATSGLT